MEGRGFYKVTLAFLQSILVSVLAYILISVTETKIVAKTVFVLYFLHFAAFYISSYGKDFFKRSQSVELIETIKYIIFFALLISFSSFFLKDQFVISRRGMIYFLSLYGIFNYILSFVIKKYWVQFNHNLKGSRKILLITAATRTEKVIDRLLTSNDVFGKLVAVSVLDDPNFKHNKVTIVPRGRAGGYMIALPKEDQMLLSKEDMKEQLAGLMGGRVAEEIIFNSQTTGASNDFEQATQMARAMVTEYGMSEKLGPVQYEGNHAMFGAQSPQKMISEQTAYEIDEEVRGLLNEARNKAAEIIQGNRETHKLIAEALLKYETLDSVQIKSLYETGKMPENSEHELEEEAKPLSYDEIKSKLEENN